MMTAGITLSEIKIYSSIMKIKDCIAEEQVWQIILLQRGWQIKFCKNVMYFQNLLQH